MEKREYTDAQIRIAIRIASLDALEKGERELRLSVRDRDYRMIRLQLMELRHLGWREIGRTHDLIALQFDEPEAEAETA
jgi:hypothetical protein